MTSHPGDQEPIDDDYEEIRAAVRQLCGDFPGSYWRGLEPDRYPEEFVTALTEHGWLAALIPEQYGGAGLPLGAAGVILEEISASGGNPGACHAQMYVMGTLLRHGNEEQRQRWLPGDRRRAAAAAGLRRHRAGRRVGHHLDQDPREAHGVRVDRSTARRSGRRAPSTPT